MLINKTKKSKRKILDTIISTANINKNRINNSSIGIKKIIESNKQ